MSAAVTTDIETTLEHASPYDALRYALATFGAS